MATPLLWTASLWAETWLLHLLFNHGTWEVLGPCIKVPHHTPSRCLLRRGRVAVCRCCGVFCLLSYQPVAGGSKEQRAHVFNMESPRPKKMDGPVTGAQSRNSHEVHSSRTYASLSHSYWSTLKATLWLRTSLIPGFRGILGTTQSPLLFSRFPDSMLSLRWSHFFIGKNSQCHWLWGALLRGLPQRPNIAQNRFYKNGLFFSLIFKQPSWKLHKTCPT